MPSPSRQHLALPPPSLPALPARSAAGTSACACTCPPPPWCRPRRGPPAAAAATPTKATSPSGRSSRSQARCLPADRLGRLQQGGWLRCLSYPSRHVEPKRRPCRCTICSSTSAAEPPLSPSAALPPRRLLPAGHRRAGRPPVPAARGLPGGQPGRGAALPGHPLHPQPAGGGTEATAAAGTTRAAAAPASEEAWLVGQLAPFPTACPSLLHRLTSLHRLASMDRLLTRRATCRASRSCWGWRTCRCTWRCRPRPPRCGPGVPGWAAACGAPGVPRVPHP